MTPKKDIRYRPLQIEWNVFRVCQSVSGKQRGHLEKIAKIQVNYDYMHEISRLLEKVLINSK